MWVILKDPSAVKIGDSKTFAKISNLQSHVAMLDLIFNCYAIHLSMMPFVSHKKKIKRNGVPMEIGLFLQGSFNHQF